MVGLLPLKEKPDLEYVQSLLIEFKNKTGSIIAEELLNGWPESASQFVKVRSVYVFYKMHETYPLLQRPSEILRSKLIYKIHCIDIVFRKFVAAC